MTATQDKETIVYIKKVKLLAGKEPEQNNKRTFEELVTVRASP